MTNVIRYYLVINNSEVTHLRADFSYQLGGYNMFTGRYEARGYYMGVVPVKITDDGDWITESFLCSSGKKKCILEVARKSQRKSDEAFVYFDAKGGSERCGFAINTPKTKAGERIIPMLPKVKESFHMEKEFQEMCGLKCNAMVDGYTDFVFINRFGGVQHQGTLNKALRRIIRDCNYEVLDKEQKNPVLLPKFSCHSLRHTFTTRMCEAGVNVKAMQDILGHADAETTLQIYADATKELKRAEMINFEMYFDKLKKSQEKAI